MQPVRTALLAAVLSLLALPCARATQSTLLAHATSAPVRAGVAATDRSADWRADVTHYARRMIDAGFFPGMQVAVTHGDRVVYARGFGVADASTGRPVDNRTRFYIASTTKALTATAVMLEVHRGQLALDAPVTHYLPDLEFKAPLRADTVTVRELLDMTDGIDSCLPVVFRTAFSGQFTQPGLIALMRHCGPSGHGHAFSYRNLPYNILGMVLAPGVRDGWKGVVRRDVLDPLHMRETSARLSTLHAALLAMPHEATGQGFKRIRLAKADANLHAAGGYFSTARDLARFVAAQASDGMFDGHRVFPAGMIESMHVSHAEQDRDFGPYHRFGWGYGWDLGTYDGHVLVHRFGRFAGYRSHVSFMPDNSIGVVVLVNGVSVPFAADEMADYIYDRLGTQGARAMQRHAAIFHQLEQRKARYASHMVAQRATRRARQKQHLPHPLTAYAGRYVNPLVGTMNWTVGRGRLTVAMGLARSRAEIYDADKNQWRVELTGGGEVVRFRFDAGAKGVADAVDYAGYRFRREPGATAGGVPKRD